MQSMKDKDTKLWALVIGVLVIAALSAIFLISAVFDMTRKVRRFQGPGTISGILLPGLLSGSGQGSPSSSRGGFGGDFMDLLHGAPGRGKRT